MLIDEIKARYTPEMYMAEHFGRTLKSGRCRSFRPGATNSTSLHIDGTRWTDFGSGEYGDVIDMVAAVEFNGDIGAAVHSLASKLGIEDSHVRVNISLNNLEADCKRYQECMGEEHYAYLAKRGIRRETADELRIGFCRDGQLNDRLIIPYIVHARVRYFIGREWHRDSGAKYMKLKRTDDNDHPIWGVDSLRREGPVFVAEGAFDAMSVYQEGYAVVSAITGQFSHPQMADLVPLLRDREVIVCMDYDPETKAGQRFTEKLAMALFEQGINVRANFLNGNGVKVDVSELYQANPSRGTIQKIIDEAESFGGLYCRTHTAKEVEDFLRRNSRRLPSEVMATMFDGARKNGALDQVYFTALAKVLSVAPTELTVKNEFIRAFDYVYQPKMGWFEWNGLVWKSRDENVVKREVAKLYGKFQSSRNTDGVFKLLRAELVREEMMDVKKNLIEFPNGYYDMETHTFHEDHDRGHFATVCMEYDYDADAKCPEWDDFVESVTDAEPTRMELIRQMFGYCLIRDARFQSAFCLLGEGSNGKSVLLKVLESFLGKVNCSHVEIAYLCEAFQRIGLITSMANICNDMRSDVSGTESVFKAVVSGDPISACYKGKDFISFEPYCKMIFSSNRMPTAREVNYSFVRRFKFLSFPVTYVEAPEKPNERLKDPDILDKLLAELPGIFNFAVQGAKNLIADGKLVTTPDQTANESELVEVSNPLITFLNDYIAVNDGFFSNVERKVVLRTYEEWCGQHSVKPMLPKTFWMRLRETADVEDAGWKKQDGSASRTVNIRKGKQWR